jgi:hypothetical protein
LTRTSCGRAWRGTTSENEPGNDHRLHSAQNSVYSTVQALPDPILPSLTPKACTPIELRRVGVIFTRREQLFECVRCGAVWNPTGWVHKRPRKYWVCPNGCNALSQLQR